VDERGTLPSKTHETKTIGKSLRIRRREEEEEEEDPDLVDMIWMKRWCGDGERDQMEEYRQKRHSVKSVERNEREKEKTKEERGERELINEKDTEIEGGVGSGVEGGVGGVTPDWSSIWSLFRFFEAISSVRLDISAVASSIILCTFFNSAAHSSPSRARRDSNAGDSRCLRVWNCQGNKLAPKADVKKLLIVLFLAAEMISFGQKCQKLISNIQIHLVTKMHFMLKIKHKNVNLTICLGLFCDRNCAHNFKKKTRQLY
jgi:hypothetical protein